MHIYLAFAYFDILFLLVISTNQCVTNIRIRICEYQSKYSYLNLYSPFFVTPNIFVFALFYQHFWVDIIKVCFVWRKHVTLYRRYFRLFHNSMKLDLESELSCFATRLFDNIITQRVFEDSD